MLRNLRRRSQQCDTENQAHSWADVLLQLSFTFLIYSFFFFLERSPSAEFYHVVQPVIWNQDNLQPKASYSRTNGSKHQATLQLSFTDLICFFFFFLVRSPSTKMAERQHIRGGGERGRRGSRPPQHKSSKIGRRVQPNRLLEITECNVIRPCFGANTRMLYHPFENPQKQRQNKTTKENK